MSLGKVLWWNHELVMSKAWRYPWQPCEQQPPGTVTLIKQWKELPKYLPESQNQGVGGVGAKNRHGCKQKQAPSKLHVHMQLEP